MTLPYDYMPNVLYAINLIGQGHTKTRACDESHVSPAILERVSKSDPLVADMLTEAEQRSYDAMADALINIDNHKVHGQSDPKMAKVISDNIKWVLSKRRPKDFGDRVQVDHSVTVDVAITTALDAARRRVGPALPAPDVSLVEEAQVVYDDDDAIMRELLG